MKSQEKARRTLINPCNHSSAKYQYSFSKQQRFTQNKRKDQSKDTFYDLPSTLAKRGATISRAKRDCQRPIHTQGPAPGQYNPKSLNIQGNIVFAPGRDKCFNLSIFYNTTASYPGPGKYDPKQQRHVPQISIAGKIEKSYETVSPGPKYNFESSLLEKNKILSRQRKTGCIKLMPDSKSRIIKTQHSQQKFEASTTQNLGFISYKAKRSLGSSGINPTIGKDLRFRAMTVKTLTPGPGQQQQYYQKVNIFLSSQSSRKHDFQATDLNYISFSNGFCFKLSSKSQLKYASCIRIIKMIDLRNPGPNLLMQKGQNGRKICHKISLWSISKFTINFFVCMYSKQYSKVLKNSLHMILLLQQIVLQFMNKAQKIFDYEVVKRLGQGSFGEVILGIKNGQKFALKKISKKQIIKVNKLHQPFVEKQILYRLNQLCGNLPFFIKIHQTESDQDNMYLVLEYCGGGTLQNLIFTTDLDIKLTQQLAAKMILILQKLHSFKVIHRDLKPSNFLFSQQGFLKLSDFGTSYAPDSFFPPEVAEKIKSIKQMNSEKEEKDKKNQENIEKIEQRRSTFVGTACYMAPELLASDTCNKQADIWALGCILYEMIFKKSPFFDSSEGMVWKKILNDQIEIIPPADLKENEMVLKLVDLIKKILVKDTEKRFGSGPEGYKDLKGHAFFQGLDWQKEATRPIEKVVQMAKLNLKSENDEKAKQKVILSGVVNKKMFFGNFKERMMILYSTPKLVYYCTQTGEKKGEIALQKNTPVGLEGKIFTITNEKKTYYFKSKTSGEWVEMIKSVIVNAYY